MPLSSEIVGRSGEPVTHAIDARWTMAFAAAFGDVGPEVLGTAARPDVLAHPLFPVCFEWPVFLSARHLPVPESLSAQERVRGVHATHELRLHRPLRAGVTVTTRATVVRVEQRKPGAFQLVRLESTDATGAPVCTTWYGTLFLGVEVCGGDRALEDLIPLAPIPGDAPAQEIEIPVPAGAAHVYTECARIWNPIHTDAAVAAAAGLPGIILHGTATLGLAVSGVVARVLDGDAARVARIAGRFGAMVQMPSVLRLRIFPAAGDEIRFEVRNAAGEPALRDGLIAVRS